MTELRNIVGFLWPFLRKYRLRLGAGVLCGLLFGMSNASFVWATKTLIDRMAPEPVVPREVVSPPRPGVAPSGLSVWMGRVNALAREAMDPWLPTAGRAIDWRQLVGGLCFFPLLIALRGLLGYGSAYLTAWVGERVVNDVRVAVFSRLTTLSLDFFHRAKTGDLINRVNTDTGTLQRYTSSGFNTLVSEPFTLISLFVALCLIDWKLTFGAAVFLPICVVPVALLGRKARRAAKAGVELFVGQANRLVEMLGSMRIVKAFGLEAMQVDRFRRMSVDLVHHQMRSIRAKEQVNPIVETISMFGFGLLVVYIAAEGRRVDDMVGFLTGLVLFYTPFRKLAVVHVMFEQSVVAVNRLRQVLAETPSVKPPDVPRRLASFQTDLRFEGVTFAYAEQTVLEAVNLVIRRGERIGIAGESGSGKSTLVNLLLRFYDPTAGAVTIDGVDLREADLDDLRRLMALVSQEVVVFDQTVAENIATGRVGATRAEIEAAAHAAYAHEFIVRLPRGYDTPIGERGATLSVGQRQRISIARAFVRNAPILLLDEATAALDAQSEAEVQVALESLEANRTVVCVAHRLSTLANMDRIIVLSAGRIAEQGTFRELTRSGGRFADMARRQGMLADYGVNL